MRVNSVVFGLLVFSAVSDAFTGPMRKASVAPPKISITRVFMSEEKEKEDLTLVPSARKQIAFDEAKGRFFETDISDADCIPDEEFCITDNDSGSMIRLTIEEKERIFLDALQSYYNSGRKMLSDDEFDLLKEDLTWNGSPMLVMNRKEAAYLNAMQAYLKGDPIMSDSEFDSLKQDLKDEGSKFAVQTEPKCYIDTGICKVTLQEDKFRSNLLYLPATIIGVVAWIGFGFEVLEPFIRINPVVLTLMGTPLIYLGARTLTEEFIFENKFLAYGPCPSCQAENRVYFGNILGVEGFTDVANAKCPNCKTTFTVQRNTLRASTLPKEN
mmetsp:Transcript_37018/g.96963  ORF Transcript_37018/g.96963 Transcript_37018/m.96963 type:complete len:327 (+) Transcript_37018:113-1093(+)